MVNPFDTTYTNAIIVNINAETPEPEALAVKGLIFDVDSTMSGDDNGYDRPQIMSEATQAESLELKPYCYNQLEDPSAFTYTANYTHIFIDNCAVLDPIVPLYFVYAGTWAAMAIFFLIYLYVFIPAESRLTL